MRNIHITERKVKLAWNNLRQKINRQFFSSHSGCWFKKIFLSILSLFSEPRAPDNTATTTWACFQATKLLVIALLLISILYSLWLLYLDNETFTFFEFSFVPVALSRCRNVAVVVAKLKNCLIEGEYVCYRWGAGDLEFVKVSAPLIWQNQYWCIFALPPSPLQELYQAAWGQYCSYLPSVGSHWDLNTLVLAKIHSQYNTTDRTCIYTQAMYCVSRL